MPSLFQAPPPGAASAGQMFSGVPPEILAFFKNLPPKNAIDWLSGDQKGADAPSEPCTTLARNASSGRSHSMRLPSGPTAENAR